MRPRDTSPEAQVLLDGYYRRMSPAEKWAELERAREMARELQLAGLRERFPEESESELMERLHERWLGTELYRAVRAVHPCPGLGSSSEPTE